MGSSGEGGREVERRVGEVRRGSIEGARGMPLSSGEEAVAHVD